MFLFNRKKKLIIDTDNGDDIDDLIAVYTALKEQYDILGIVCSYLNSPLRKKQIIHTLKLHNATNIPVFAGCMSPIEGLHGCDINKIYCQYTEEIGNTENLVSEENESIDFLINSAKKYKDNLTILEISPETTLAKAIDKDRNAFSKTKIYLMAGCFYRNEPEWNIECDFKAAKTILESNLNLHYVGLDVTEKTILENPELENLLLRKYQDSRRQYLSTCSNLWVQTSKRHIVLHDVLALLSIYNKKIVNFTKEKISFCEKDGHFYTKIDNTSKFSYMVANDVNLDIVNSYLRKLMED